MQMCCRCKVRPVEDFGDGERSLQCGQCNDRDIEHSEQRREWDHFHPGEPMPKGGG
jgi:hypothetical protein